MSRALAVFLVTVAAATSVSLVKPGATLQPGRLLDGHAALRDDCLACHAPLEGVRSDRCTKCHTPDSVGVTLAAGGAALEPREAIATLHRRVAATPCVACHAEHAGRLDGGRAARFDHSALPADLRAECDTCHADRRPADDLHTALAPADACASCHSKAAWKPATFDHDTFFRFDEDHPSRCSGCHTPGSSLKVYSCTGCHEHSPSDIESEHRKEGINDFADCVACHRSGDEHDTRVQGGRVRRDGRRGGRRHDDDDHDDDDHDDDDD